MSLIFRALLSGQEHAITLAGFVFMTHAGRKTHWKVAMITPSSRHSERGVTIAMVAIFIIVLFIVAALAIDMGLLYTARTSAQHAADAAALAGAFTFLNPAAVQPAAAQNAAINVGAQNSILGTQVSLAASDVAVDTSSQTVTVTVSRLAGSGISTFFANVMGIKTVDLQTKATAQASKRGSASFCVKPFWIPNDVLGSCAQGKELFDANGNLTTYAQSQLGAPINIWYKVTPSQWSLWDTSVMGVDFDTAMSKCINLAGSKTPLKCSDTLQVNTGAKVGQVAADIKNVITSSNDTFIAPGEYQDGSTGQIKDTSPQLATIPVWDTCNSGVSPGSTSFPVGGWAVVFLESVGGVGTGITARFVGATSCTGNTGSGTGPQATPVRLVQTQ